MSVNAPVAPPPSASEPRRFGFRLPPITHAILVLWGVIKAPEVSVDAQQITVRFGWFKSSFLISDMVRFELDGPYTWWRALAVRHTAFKTDISYCTDERGAVRIYLKSQRRVLWAGHVDLVYLGVEDLQGLADTLRGLGIPGEDKRNRTGA